jgi:hypothetical protein
MHLSLFFSVFLLMGCKHIGLIFEPPATLKAVVQGQIKGVSIHCEKILKLGNVKWEVMCKVSDDIDIKYRTQAINNDQAKLEIVVDKQAGDSIKTLVAPVIFFSKNKPAILETAIEKGHIAIRTEPMP